MPTKPTNGARKLTCRMTFSVFCSVCDHLGNLPSGVSVPLGWKVIRGRPYCRACVRAGRTNKAAAIKRIRKKVKDISREFIRLWSAKEGWPARDVKRIAYCVDKLRQWDKELKLPFKFNPKTMLVYINGLLQVRDIDYWPVRHSRVLRFPCSERQNRIVCVYGYIAKKRRKVL